MSLARIIIWSSSELVQSRSEIWGGPDSNSDSGWTCRTEFSSGLENSVLGQILIWVLTCMQIILCLIDLRQYRSFIYIEYGNVEASFENNETATMCFLKTFSKYFIALNSVNKFCLYERLLQLFDFIKTLHHFH